MLQCVAIYGSKLQVDCVFTVDSLCSSESRMLQCIQGRVVVIECAVCVSAAAWCSVCVSVTLCRFLSPCVAYREAGMLCAGSGNRMSAHCLKFKANRFYV